MKKTILIVVFISLIFTCNAQENRKITDEQRKLDSLGISKNIVLLSLEICRHFSVGGTNIAEKTKISIKKHMTKYEKIKSPSLAQIIEFLNANKNYMTCGDDNKNYMMESFEQGAAYDQLFNTLYLDEFLPEDESEPNIDLNAISYTGKNGTPETVLDYMFRKLNSPITSEGIKREIKDLIDSFESLNAKRYSDLSEEEKSGHPLYKK